MDASFWRSQIMDFPWSFTLRASAFLMTLKVKNHETHETKLECLKVKQEAGRLFVLLKVQKYSLINTTCLSVYPSVCPCVCLSFRTVVDSSWAFEESGPWRFVFRRRLQFLHHHTGSDLTNSAICHDGHARPRWGRISVCLTTSVSQR